MAKRASMETLGQLPLVRQWREARYTRRFFAHTSLMKNLYRGVYPTFAAAQASVEPDHAVGYDNTSSADLYRDHTRHVYINDYPAMLWFSKLFEAGSASVFDLGGHIGLAYYAYQRYVHYPDGISWCVHDVPAVNAAGRRWAEQHDIRKRLTFSDRAQDASGVDIFFAAGSLQYLDYSLAELLAGLPRKPKHLLLNSVPIHTRESYFTVQNTGIACCPYRITAEREFLDKLKALGYRMQDRWENPHRGCTIPFYPEHSLDRYFGFCFSREA